MKEIDLRLGNREFVVSTTVTRNGTAYMGPDVRVNARDAEHAKEVVTVWPQSKYPLSIYRD